MANEALFEILPNLKTIIEANFSTLGINYCWIGKGLTIDNIAEGKFPLLIMFPESMTPDEENNEIQESVISFNVITRSYSDNKLEANTIKLLEIAKKIRKFFIRYNTIGTAKILFKSTGAQAIIDLNDIHPDNVLQLQNLKFSVYHKELE